MDKSKTFVLGDVHGAFKALKQCLGKANFDYENDKLICLGDICDGWPETRESFDELLKINHLEYILGNHDKWGLEWMQDQKKPNVWLMQGGDATIESYSEGPVEAHKELLQNAHDYFILDNKLFVHGGISLDKPLDQQDKDIFLWDRNLINKAIEKKKQGFYGNLTEFEEIYIGHTPTLNFGVTHPIKACEVWLIDTGAGWNGVLTIMNIETKEYFISDPVPDLYPGHTGRF